MTTLDGQLFFSAPTFPSIEALAKPQEIVTFPYRLISFFFLLVSSFDSLLKVIATRTRLCIYDAAYNVSPYLRCVALILISMYHQ